MWTSCAQAWALGPDGEKARRPSLVGMRESTGSYGTSQLTPKVMRRAPHERLAGVAIHDRSPLAYRRVAGIVQRRAGRGQRLRVERQRRPADPTEALTQSRILKSKLFVFALELHDPAPDLQDPLAEVGVAERVQGAFELDQPGQQTWGIHRTGSADVEWNRMEPACPPYPAEAVIKITRAWKLASGAPPGDFVVDRKTSRDGLIRLNAAFRFLDENGECAKLRQKISTPVIQ